jgi:hypothetical protein
MELALATNERKVLRPGHTFYRPVGAVLLARSAEVVRRKWAEIICVLCSPVRRTAHGPTYAEKFADFPHTGVLSRLWKPEWFDAYWRHERRPEDLPLDDLWRLVTGDGRVLDALPQEPLGTCHITEAWPWSDLERKQYFLCALDESGLSAVERETIDARGPYQVGGVTHSGPLNRIDWKTDLGFAAKDVLDILDPAKIVHPKLDRPLSPTLIKAVSLGH